MKNVLSKFGSGSLVFDGTGDWLVPRNLLPLGSGNFTVEMWLYPNATYSGAYAGILDSRTSGDGAGLVYFGYTGTANQIGWKDNTTNVVKDVLIVLPKVLLNALSTTFENFQEV